MNASVQMAVLAAFAAGIALAEALPERKGVVERKGTPLTLVGAELKVGDKAPEAQLVGNDLAPVKLSVFRGKVLVLAAVPSLDTPVCDRETRRFNEEAAKLGKDVAVVTVSMDLPFAQKRWCGAAGIQNIITLSDHRDASLGMAYGVLIKESRLLARAVFVVDREGTIQYVQVVKELTSEPDYNAVLAAVKRLLPQ
jgi:thiol peroxidase